MRTTSAKTSAKRLTLSTITVRNETIVGVEQKLPATTVTVRSSDERLKRDIRPL